MQVHVDDRPVVLASMQRGGQRQQQQDGWDAHAFLRRAVE
jgi:hypothetical protein